MILGRERFFGVVPRRVSWLSGGSGTSGEFAANLVDQKNRFQRFGEKLEGMIAHLIDQAMRNADDPGNQENLAIGTQLLYLYRELDSRESLHHDIRHEKFGLSVKGPPQRHSRGFVNAVTAKPLPRNIAARVAEIASSSSTTKMCGLGAVVIGTAVKGDD